jgi:hypothetical protein
MLISQKQIFELSITLKQHMILVLLGLSGKP